MNRHTIFLLLLSCTYLLSYSQRGQWIWVKGSNQPNALASFGTEGVPSSTNEPQAVGGAANWIDKQGNFWLFGGFNTNLAVPCTMWKFSPADNNWTWMSGSRGIQYQDVAGPGKPIYGTRGIAADSVFPGARMYPAQWTDTSGNLWLFGGFGWDSTGYPGIFDDLWEYNTSTNQWTWVSGRDQINAPDIYGPYQQATDSAVPGARYASSAWVDARNNLWLFGGVENTLSGFDTSYNDMWRYNVATGQWTWMNGPQWGGDPGNYGTMGVENASNEPPHRTTFSRWKDSTGNFYLWGGGDYWNSGSYYSDVWKYDVATNYWVWIAGEDTEFSLGVYTHYCSDNGSTGPSARTFNSTPAVAGPTNLFVTYAGFRSEDSATLMRVGLDDLWVFNSTTNQWRWISGERGAAIPANYGAIGVAAPTNLPGSRYQENLWVDCSGTLWMFGGEGNTPYAMFNDVWEYIPDSACSGGLLEMVSAEGSYQLSADTICAGGQAVISINGITHPAITPSGTVTWQSSSTAALAPSVTTTYTLTGITSCNVPDTIMFTINVGSGISASLTANPLTICSNDSSQICTNGTFASYLWNNGDTTRCIEVNGAGDYYVTITNSGGCTGVSNHISITVYPTPSVAISVTADTLYAYNQVSYQWYLNGTILTGDTDSILIASQPGTYSVQVTDTNGCTTRSNGQVVSGIGNMANAKALKIFPDPTTDELNLTYALNGAANLHLNIADLTGRLVETVFNGQQNGGSYDIHINTSALAPGIYILNFATETQSLNLRFCKQ